MRCVVAGVAVVAMFECAAFATCLLPPPALAREPDDPPGRRSESAAVSSAELATLTRQLTDARFSARERASRRLESLGLAAFAAVEQVVREGDREAQSRAFLILKGWSRSPQPKLDEAASDLLNQLSESSVPGLARQANDILQWRRLAIHRDAVKFLEGLDARVTTREANDGHHTTVHIARTWRGHDEDLDRLRELVGLNWLSVEDSGVGNRGVEAIAACPDLQFLMLGRSAVTPVGLGPLSRLQRLQHLSLQELPVTGESLVALGPMPGLTSLGLDQTRLTNDDLVHLRGFPNLKNLWLDRTGITDEGLERITHLSNLTHLYLLGTKTGGAGLRHLARLPRLSHLSLKEVQLTPEGVRELGALTTLVSLGLDQSNITDAMLGELEGLRNLQVVWLTKTPVTDGAFVHLERLVGLRTVYAHGAHFSKEGAEKFMRQTDDRCRVHF